MADRQQPALMRHSGIIVLLSVLAVSPVLMTGCDRAGQKGGIGTWFSGARVDTITVRDTITLRDTIVVVDTMLAEKEIILRDTTLVEKEIIKRVEVPAQIPTHYRAWNRLVAESIAPIADENMCFAGLKSIEVSVAMSEDAKDILSQQRAEDKFELTLRQYGVPLSDSSPRSRANKRAEEARQYGVPLSDSSPPYILLTVDVFLNDAKTISTFNISVSLIEPLVFYRNNKPYKRLVVLWTNGSFGRVGKNLARETFLESIEANAERVANLYLSAN